jgi:hypothetical protein
MRKLIGWLSSLGILVGCGGDGSGIGPLEETSVTGSWNAIWQSMNGSGMSCSTEGGRLELNQTGSRFTGSYHVESLTCNGSRGSASTGAVVNGTVVGNQVAFDLNDPGIHQSGTLNGDEMSGPATWTRTIDGTSFSVSGTWTANRTCRNPTAPTAAYSC